ncbi:MAG: DoxX family protein [Steroidobacteraceae bacterium]|nr:DoxX family protein [Steroidobacteraceae bacterium]
MATNGGWHAAVLRIPIGMIFVAYGAQKLFGWFGGYGPSGTGQWMESVGLSPGYAMAVLAGSAEFFGGLELIVGFLVRPAALVLAVTMAVALSVVHWRNGLFISNNGYEYALALLGVSAALAISGAGRLSIDHELTSRT